MPTKVGINGFGRIGRNIFRAATEADSDLEFVAVNDITDPETLAHLLKYDSIYGRLQSDVAHSENSITVNGKEVKVFAQRDPAQIPWGEMGAEIVIESTGLFSSREDAAKHLRDSVKKVIISAPGKGQDLTVCLGVNEDRYDPDQHSVISNASCTTNCLAPVAKVLHEHFGIRKGLMTTIHSYTNDQRILDLPHKDLRRARAAALSMIPTTTGAAIAVTLVLPELKGKLDGISIRVPTPTVSLIDLTATLEKDVTESEVQGAFREAAQGKLKGILAYSEEPLVSSDFIKDPHSAVVDGPFTKTLANDMVKVLAWYDNEWAYSNRVLELAGFIGKRLATGN
ncbi:type I glyceraldehyde-3-phosphate dehydrogenase [Acidobacteria bacterium AH-259-D05]|nr:type I glyceraldehyde-3-phosphate dehydrogenase [Acidobacteria bacterium AH-259-D05]